MNCPVCKDERLAISDKNGIEIDYCPKCRGIWLDRGELDKIIERSTSYASSADTHSNKNYSHDKYQQNTHHNSYDSHKYHQNSSHGYHKKKESFLSELFDF